MRERYTERGDDVASIPRCHHRVRATITGLTQRNDSPRLARLQTLRGDKRISVVGCFARVEKSAKVEGTKSSMKQQHLAQRFRVRQFASHQCLRD